MVSTSGILQHLEALEEGGVLPGGGEGGAGQQENWFVLLRISCEPDSAPCKVVISLNPLNRLSLPPFYNWAN